MAYTFRYELIQAPQATTDGSGMVLHDVRAVYQVNGGWVPIGGRHKSIAVLFTEISTVLAMPNGAAKNAAYKEALRTNLNTAPSPLSGWDSATMTQFLDRNTSAATQAAAADTWITVDLGLSYPVRFSI